MDVDYFDARVREYTRWAADAERDGRLDDCENYTRAASRCATVAANIRRKAAAIAAAAAAEKHATRGVCGEG